MKAALITIGDELLIGQTINTNIAWLGKQLSETGISVILANTIKDEEKIIIETLDLLKEEVELILITGGLGPTNDDLTKETLTKYFDTELVLHEDVLEHIKAFFKNQGEDILDSDIQQALLPKNCTVLKNTLGTASGMWFEEAGKTIISLPGVPYEMEALFTNEVLPRLKTKFDVTGIYYQTLMVQGIEESFLAQKIEEWENRIYADGLHLAYLPTPGIIRLRLSTERNDTNKVDRYLKELKQQFPQYIYGINDDSIFDVVGKIMKEKRKTLGTVESCTGGGIANAFIGFPGASEFFMGGLVTYSNELKMKWANVSSETLEKYGAVSKETAIEMALGGQKKLETDYVISVTGIAGPDGGTEEKPVGTVWICVAAPGFHVAKKYLFGENRERNLIKTQLTATNLLRKVLLGMEP